MYHKQHCLYIMYFFCLVKKNYHDIQRWRISLQAQTYILLIDMEAASRSDSTGDRGTRSFISGEQGYKGLKMWGTGEQSQFQGT